MIFKFKVGDKVQLKGYKRPFWIHQLSEEGYADGNYRVTDSYFDIGDPRSNWNKSMWVKETKILNVIIN